MFRYITQNKENFLDQDSWVSSSPGEIVSEIDTTESKEKQSDPLEKKFSNVENNISSEDNNDEDNNDEDNNDEDSDDEDSDDEDSDDEDSDDEDSDDSESMYFSPPNYKLTQNSDIFVVLKDSIPQFYLQNHASALKSMWGLARFYKSKWCNNYNVYIREGQNSDKIEVFGYYKFFIVAYERFITSFEIKSVKELYYKEENM
jgi:hypothetical protein